MCRAWDFGFGDSGLGLGSSFVLKASGTFLGNGLAGLVFGPSGDVCDLSAGIPACHFGFRVPG